MSPAFWSAERRYGDAGSARTQHVGKEFLGQRHNWAAYSVLAHQQPTRQSFVHVMRSIARGDLRCLHR